MPGREEAYIPFSVFDNPDIAFRQTYEAALNKIRDQATKERLLYGNWDFVEANDMAVYHNFDGSGHLITNLKEKVSRSDQTYHYHLGLQCCTQNVYFVGSDKL